MKQRWGLNRNNVKMRTTETTLSQDEDSTETTLSQDEDSTETTLSQDEDSAETTMSQDEDSTETTLSQDEDSTETTLSQDEDSTETTCPDPWVVKQHHWNWSKRKPPAELRWAEKQTEKSLFTIEDCLFVWQTREESTVVFYIYTSGSSRLKDTKPGPSARLAVREFQWRSVRRRKANFIIVTGSRDLSELHEVCGSSSSWWWCLIAGMSIRPCVILNRMVS